MAHFLFFYAAANVEDVECHAKWFNSCNEISEIFVGTLDVISGAIAPSWNL
jgi:hypothetical protein